MKSRQKKLRRACQVGKSTLFSALFIFFCACGYRLRVPLNPVFDQPKGIVVPVFDNLSDEVGAERVFTNALIREIQIRRDIPVVSAQGGAELRGVIESINYAPTSSSALGFKGLQSYRRLPTEMGVRVSLQLTLHEVATQKTLWSRKFFGFRRVNTPLNRTADFEASSHVGPLTQSLVESLYAEIARDIMRDVYDEMMESL